MVQITTTLFPKNSVTKNQHGTNGTKREKKRSHSHQKKSASGLDDPRHPHEPFLTSLFGLGAGDETCEKQSVNINEKQQQSVKLCGTIYV